MGDFGGKEELNLMDVFENEENGNGIIYENCVCTGEEQEMTTEQNEIDRVFGKLN